MTSSIYREATPAQVRERLAGASKLDLLQKVVYLSGCRPAEALDPRYRLERQDFQVEHWRGFEYLTIQLRTAKRGGLTRTIASSLGHDYLAREVWEGLNEEWARGRDPFDVSIRSLQRAVAETFWGLSYTIMPYSVTEDPAPGSEERVQRKVPLHVNSFDVKGLRHLMATERSSVNGFTPEDLARYFGWTMASIRMSNMVERYVLYNWKNYSEKLLIRPPWGPAPISQSPGGGGQLNSGGGPPEK